MPDQRAGTNWFADAANDAGNHLCSLPDRYLGPAGRLLMRSLYAREKPMTCPECGSYTKNGCGHVWHDTAPESVEHGCGRHGWDICRLCESNA